MLYILNSITLIMSVLLGVAFLTLLERKVLSYIQFRKGPNKLGFKGLGQPFSDAIKLLSKEWSLYKLNLKFLLSPMSMLVASLFTWVLYPWINADWISNGVVFLMVILGINVYPVIMLSWSSSSNYAMLGALRTVAQMISFEISLFLMLVILMLMCEDFGLTKFTLYQSNLNFSILLFPLYIAFFVSMLIELNRTPFDLIEGESELVSGFNVEYHGSFFTMIFLAEYSGILFTSMILSMMFYGYSIWSYKFLLIYSFHLLLILFVRGLMPRMKYDVLMMICWEEIMTSMLMYLYYIILVKHYILLLAAAS